MKTYYIYAVQQPDQSGPVAYRTLKHKPRYQGDPAGSYSQAYVASTGGQRQFAVCSVRAASREDALAKYVQAAEAD